MFRKKADNLTKAMVDTVGVEEEKKVTVRTDVNQSRVERATVKTVQQLPLFQEYFYLL